MKERTKHTVKTIKMLSLCGTLITFILGTLHEFIGYAKFEQMLSGIGISNGTRWLWIVGTPMALVLIITTSIEQKM